MPIIANHSCTSITTRGDVNDIGCWGSLPAVPALEGDSGVGGNVRLSKCLSYTVSGCDSEQLTEGH